MGLIAIEPTLSIMICAKENAGAQAVAEHIVSMPLTDALLGKFGRLIGFHEAQKGASARTAIDVGSQNRNQVLCGKQVIIGCGGGFQHETAQKYSPILEWMAKIQLCLHNEAQQFGNLDEVAALARLPASCICIWTGDHKQTLGDLKKTPEAITFRHKMMKPVTPLAQALWLKLPSRLKILVKNGTSVLSIHLDQVSARSVGWPLVYFFLLNCPVTCCLDPFFHLHEFFHLLLLFYNRPGLSLWQVPPISFLYLPHTFLSPSYRPGLSLWQVPPIPSSTLSTPFSLPSIGPACHCGRSRLFPSSSFSTPPSSSLSYRPGLSL